MNSFNLTKKNNTIQNNDDIDLIAIYRTLLRSKFTLIRGSLLLTFLILAASFFLKPIYTGKFQMSTKIENNFAPNDKISNNLLSLSNVGIKNTQKTKLLILKSPSVLNSVYEYHKNYLKNKNIKTTNFNFEKWIELIDIKFEERSDILTVVFDYPDKKHISSTLKLINQKYKDYSIENRIRNLERSKEYLTSQSKFLKEKSTNSLKKFNEFSIKHGLGNIDGFYDLETTNPVSGFGSNNFKTEFGIGNNESLNQINQLTILSEIGSNNTEKAGQRYQSQNQLLEKYERQINDLKSKLKPTSKTIETLQRKIDNLKSRLKRPNEILLKYRELSTTAKRDERFLQDIENRLSLLNIEIARKEEPWQVISDVYVNPQKIAPKRKLILLMGFLGSFLFMSFLILFKEKRSGIIREFKEIENLIDSDYRLSIYLDNASEDIELIKSLIKSDFDKLKDNNLKMKDVILLDLSNQTQEISNFLENKIECKIISTNDTDIINKSKYVILLVRAYTLKYYDIQRINNINEIYKNKIYGWIYIN